MNEASDEGKTRGAWGWRAREPGHGEPGPAALRPASTRWYLAPAAARAVPGSETSPSASPCFQDNSSRRLFFLFITFVQRRRAGEQNGCWAERPKESPKVLEG